MLTFAALPTGDLIQIDALQALPKEARPACKCVACERPLIPKLGKLVQHHFAHTPDSNCYAATGEGALHLSAKLRLKTLLEQLASGSGELCLQSKCPFCKKPRTLPLLSLLPEDLILVEKQYDQFRPDLQLSRGEQILCAFEIAVTHLSTTEKWAAFLQKGTPAVEIQARDILGDEEITLGPWSPPAPLPFARGENLPPPPLCASCQKEKERRERMAKPTLKRHALKVCHVDQLLVEGQRIRHCLVASAVFLGEEFVSARLVTNKGTVLREWDSSVMRDALDQEIRDEAKKWARSLGDRKSFELDIFGGFQELPRSPLADRYPDASSGLHKQEKIAMAHSPEPTFWWEPTKGQWVKCYTEEHVRRRVSDSLPGSFEQWWQEGKFPEVIVQRERGQFNQRRIHAEKADVFLLLRDKKTEEQQRLFDEAHIYLVKQ
jgi:hypothetical protein